MEQIKSLSDLQSLFKKQVSNKHISTCPYGGPQPYLKRSYKIRSNSNIV